MTSCSASVSAPAAYSTSPSNGAGVWRAKRRNGFIRNPYPIRRYIDP